MKIKEILIGEIVKLARERDEKQIIKILKNIEKRINLETKR